MAIYVHTFRFGNYMELLHYTADAVPRINEIIYFPHYGQYKVKDVRYYISDDTKDSNKLMWIDILAEEMKGE